eukprot:scaffold214_cov247-Chaetoceros_neogracile.AAC.6
MSDWDDMFSAAAGVDAHPNIEIRGRTLTSSDEPPQKKKSKKSRKSVSVPSTPLQSVLQSRMDPIDNQVWDQLPNWLSIGSSLCSRKVCSQWTQHDTSFDAICTNCNRGILHHSLHLIPSSWNASALSALESFTMVRNIRCCCSCILEGSNSDANDATVKDYARVTVRIAKQLVQSNLCTTLPRGEGEILDRKFQTIARSANSFKEKVKAWCKKKSDHSEFQLKGVFDELVQLIIDCDAAYFRMYYLQNSGMIPIQSSTVFIPHPPTYFGTQNLTWRRQNNCLENFMKVARAKSNLKNEDWRDLVKMLGVIQVEDLIDLDPLSFMHQNRMAESIFIFWKSGWLSSEDTRREMKEAVMTSSKMVASDPEEEFYDAHQTPAPLILQNWRDSCRDLLCNLYAYATLSPPSLKGIVEVLKDIGISDFLEMGAGTGYVSRLFQQSGVQVSAFDIVPTSADGQGAYEANEYHGLSPSYLPVSRAESKDIPSLMSNRIDAKKIALLLCYAPPLSTMAEDTLRMFIKSGGRVLVHIGEFKGLTGSEKLEKFLKTDFCLKHRTQCLRWGTDAAEATVWVKKSKIRDVSSMPLLLPCSYCLESEATKRCTLLRQLVYCSSDCCELHSTVRTFSAWFSITPSTEDKEGRLFENGNLFQPL